MRKEYHRAHRKDRVVSSIYINKELLHIAKLRAYEEGISLCDYIERALRLWIGLCEYANIIQKSKGGLNTLLVHLIDRTTRDDTQPVKPVKFQQEPAQAAAFDSEGWYCPNCKRIVTATQRAMRIRCVRCNSPVQLKRR